jgi:hypothetical protein
MLEAPALGAMAKSFFEVSDSDFMSVWGAERSIRQKHW